MSWLAQTKFQPPRLRADVISRPRLLTELRQALDTCALTLLAAPAGYGKTTLLADWLSKLRIENAELRMPETAGPVLLPFSIPNSQFSIPPQGAWLPALRRRPRVVLAAGVAVALLLGAGALRARYDHNLLHLQAPELESVRWQTTLAKHTTGASWHALSYRPTRQEALALAEQLGMRPLMAHCHRGLGTLYAKIGRLEHARSELSTAIDLYQSMDMTFWLPEAEAALAQMEGW